ncbi:MAG: DUF3006 domain-containing protein [bacterium]|nr:DUF3006 domain-containing protein [bacterium]
MPENFLQTILDRFEGELAVLKTDHGQEFLWPRERLPEGAKESSVVYLEALLSPEKEAEREKLAKKILNEILNPKK